MSEEIKKIENITNVVSENKSIALMCPKCFSIVGACKQKLEVEFTRKSEPVKLYSHKVEIKVDGWCDECKEYIEEFITIDGNIAPTISLLNQKGYKTLFCCEGHEETSESAYIYFRNIKYLKYILFIPKGWKIDVYDYTNMRSFIIRSKCNNYNVSELYDWANRLPILPDISISKTIPDDELVKILLNFPEELLEFDDEETQE